MSVECSRGGTTCLVRVVLLHQKTAQVSSTCNGDVLDPI